MKASEKFKVLGSEELKERENVAVLNGEEDIGQAEDSEPETVTETTTTPEAKSCERPPKPHPKARPCPFWEEHHSDPENPCQAWITKPNIGQCSNCLRAGRVGEQEYKLSRVSASIFKKALDIASEIFEKITRDFKKTPEYVETEGTAFRIAKKAEEIKGRDFSKPYQKLQRLVIELLAAEANWLYDECKKWAREKEEGNNDLLMAIDRAFEDWQRVVFQEQERTRTTGGYPRWFWAKELRWQYWKLIVVTRERIAVSGAINGFREALKAASPERSKRYRRRRW